VWYVETSTFASIEFGIGAMAWPVAFLDRLANCAGTSGRALAATEHWTGILTIIVKPPSSAEVLRKNPLGLYVNAIDWSRELGTQ
jgi:type IV secretory pathway TrbF-like protein